MHYYFTWREFGLTMAAALLLYYLIVALCCYRQELAAFFQSPKELPPGQSAMGAVQEDDAEMGLVSSADLDFAPQDKNKVLLLGSLADFMQELKTLVRITIEGEDTKENFLSLFSLIAGKYAQLMDGSFNESIMNYVLDSGLPFAISQNELANLLNNLNDE